MIKIFDIQQIHVLNNSDVTGCNYTILTKDVIAGMSPLCLAVYTCQGNGHCLVNI